MGSGPRAGTQRHQQSENESSRGNSTSWKQLTCHKCFKYACFCLFVYFPIYKPQTLNGKSYFCFPTLGTPKTEALTRGTFPWPLNLNLQKTLCPQDGDSSPMSRHCWVLLRDEAGMRRQEKGIRLMCLVGADERRVARPQTGPRVTYVCARSKLQSASGQGMDI